jgi:hypothetical protein
LANVEAHVFGHYAWGNFILLSFNGDHLFLNWNWFWEGFSFEGRLVKFERDESWLRTERVRELSLGLFGRSLRFLSEGSGVVGEVIVDIKPVLGRLGKII